MAQIAPAVLAENGDHYRNQIETLQTFASRVHVDITDGEFAPSFTVSVNDMWWPQEWQADVHAMVARPSEYVQAIVAKKPNLIIFHAEVQEELLPILQYVKQQGIGVGVALQKPTVPSTVAPLIEASDHVMVFSGDLGRYGGKASLMQLEKIRLIRKINPSTEIGWDGGVNIENVFTLAQGGVDVLNVGGAIAKSADPAAAYSALIDEINKKGVV